MKEKPTQAKLKEGSLLLYFGTNYQLELCQEWGMGQADPSALPS